MPRLRENGSLQGEEFKKAVDTVSFGVGLISLSYLHI